jgi:putative transcriptional regulator
MPIINHVSRELGARRLNIQEASKQTGLSYGTVFDLYHGKVKRVDITTLEALCRTFGVQVGDLLEYVPDSESQTH